MAISARLQPRVLSLTALALSAALLGALVVAVAGTPKWLALAIIVFGGSAVLFLSGSLVRTLLVAYVIVAPIAISKALAAGAAVYGPALEITPSDLCVAGLLLLAVVHRRRSGHGIVLRDVIGLGATVFFFGWSWVSAFHAEIVGNGVLAALNLSKYFVAFYVMATMLDSPRWIRLVVAAAAVGMALQIGVAGAQLATKSMLLIPGAKTTTAATLGIDMTYRGSGGAVTAFRPFGLMQHPIFLATYLVLLLPTPIAFVLAGRSAISTRGWWISLALVGGGVCALVATLSRGGWIAFAAAVAFVLLAGHSLKVVRRSQIVGAALLGVLGVVAILVAYPNAYYRLTQSDSRSTESRILLLRGAKVVISNAPLMGVGLSGYTRAAKRVLPSEFAGYPEDFRENVSSNVVHNGLLAIWAERGAIGLLALLLVYGTLMRAVITRRDWRAPEDRVLALGIAAGLAGQLVMYNFDPSYLDSRPGILWPLLGVLSALLRMQPRLSARRAVTAGTRPPALPWLAEVA